MNADEKNLMTLYKEDLIEVNDKSMKVAMQIRSHNLRQPRYETRSHRKSDHDDDDDDEV